MSKEARELPSFLLDGLDQGWFDELCRSTEEHRDHKLKYSDFPLWLGRAWKEAVRLKLDTSSPLDILDIGIGPGYFLHVCQKLGHRCVGIDRSGYFPFWQGLRQWLGIKHVIEHTIKPGEPLPAAALGGRFDLATAFRAQFNYNPNEKRLWNLDEWSCFLDDLRDHVLKPSGHFTLGLAKQEHKGSAGGLRRDDESFLSFMARRGAVQTKMLLNFAPLQ